MKNNKEDEKDQISDLENIPELIEVAKKITNHINQFEETIESRVDKLEEKIDKLQK
jgi:hypothetical protein